MMDNDSIISNDIKPDSNNNLPIYSKLKNNHKSKQQVVVIEASTVSKTSTTKMTLQFIDNNISKENESSPFIKLISNTQLLINIAKYVEFDELLNLKNSSKYTYRLINKSITQKIIQKGIISKKSRRIFWSNNINLTKVKNIVRNELQMIDEKDDSNMYKLIIDKMTLVKFETNGLDKNNRPIKTPFAKTVEEISRDLGRTFHENKFTTPEFLSILERILCAISYIRPEIGYCQGMNFVAAALLELMDDEELSFWIFLNFLDDIELNSLYFENMPDYNIRIFQLNFYIKKYIQPLFNHFSKFQINPDLILSKWILTIFSSYLPFDMLSKVWDVFILDNWKAIITFSLVFLYILKDKFLQMDLQKISKYIRENSRKNHFSLLESLDLYDRFDISNKELDELREEYFKDLVMKKIDVEDHSSWEVDQLEALNIYKEALKKLNDDNKDLIGQYKNKVEHYDRLFKISKESLKKVNQKSLEMKLEIEEIVDLLASQNNLLKILNNTKDDKKTKVKVNKKIAELVKSMNNINKDMISQYSLLDEKKDIVDRIKKKLFQYKNLFEDKMNYIKAQESNLITQLSERLKLSEKFVRTSKF